MKKSDYRVILIQEGVERFLGWPGKTVNISMATGRVEIRTICVSNRIVEDDSSTDCWVPPPPPPLWWRRCRPVSNFSFICFAPTFKLGSPNYRLFPTVATSMCLNCWPINRNILFEVTALIRLYPSVLLAEQLNTKCVRMLLGITAAPCISYDSALLLPNFICHSLAF